MDLEAGIGLSWPVHALPLPTRQLASPLTERAGVLWGALDAPVRIRLEVETLAAEQFGDDAFELRFWRERHSSWNMTSLFPETFLHLAGIRGEKEKENGEKEEGRSQGPPSKLFPTSLRHQRKLGCGSLLLPLTSFQFNLLKFI